ncbi:MAG: adenylyl-sulfate kinase [Bacteroidetes bacterium]|nr:adenylyl-sulfate kinase [Bacteroidota bacterium]MBU1719621.1 adenylyl-sulfate kinase [Bacteroidota bacterium]
MLSDVLLISEKHHLAGAKILEVITKNPMPGFIVAISGESGSGKSELAHVIAKGLVNVGVNAKVLHTDNYYLTHPLERSEWRRKHGMEAVGYTEYNWEKLNENINAFLSGSKTEMPCIDLINNQVDTLVTDFKDVKVLVIDGLYAIKAQQPNLRVFIELTYHETKKAQLSRGKEPQNELRMQVLEREHQVVQSFRSTADIFITKEYEVVIK